MTERSIRTAVVVAAALGVALIASPIRAYDTDRGDAQAPEYEQQQRSFEQEHQSPEQEAAALTDTKIEQFVEAMVEVEAIREEVSAELEATADAEEARQVQQEAQAKMVEAVQNSGLTVPEYNRIAALMNTDPSLKQRIEARVNERS